jgi:hypothetical protein
MLHRLLHLIRWSSACKACGNDPCSNATTDCPDY